MSFKTMSILIPIILIANLFMNIYYSATRDVIVDVFGVSNLISSLVSVVIVMSTFLFCFCVSLILNDKLKKG